MLFWSVVAGARPLPMDAFGALMELSKPAIKQAVMIPLAIHSVLDTSQITLGRRQFFRVTEDVVFDGTLLFGAGAVASGYIREIERDEAGRCVAIGIEMGSVQGVDGGMVRLGTRLIYIKTSLADTISTRLEIEMHLQERLELNFE
jgi:hypothetical protein